MVATADYWIRKLQLTKHVEGGSFRETYRSPLILPAASIGNSFTAARAASTSIYFLLEAGQFSAFHRIKSDETWHFYEGDTLEIFEISTDGELLTHKLGRNYEKGESFQLVIKANCWFGSRVANAGQYSLVGCTVAPGFDFEDFELANRNELSKLYPAHESLISELTYK
jgi:uncharacterized protein